MIMVTSEPGVMDAVNASQGSSKSRGAFCLSLVAIGWLALAAVRADAVETTQGFIAFHDFGTVTPHESLVYDFVLSNSTDSAWQFLTARPSCDCVDVLSLPEVIPAHGEGQLPVRVSVGGAGLSDWTISVSLAGEVLPRLLGLSAVVRVAKEESIRADLLAQPAEILKVQGTPAGGDLCWVDTRHESQYRVGHIAEALNLPLYVLKTKAFLKNKRVVLVNEGHDVTPLLEEAERLRALGFTRVQALEGGVRGWQFAGGALVGEHPHSSAVAQISPEQFYVSRGTPGWRIARLMGSGGAADGLFSMNGVTNLTMDAASLPGWIATASSSGGASQRWLVVDESGTNYEEVEQALQSMKLPPVFYLSGGAHGYEQHLAQRLSQLNRQLVSLSSASSRRSFPGSSGARTGGCCGGGK